MKKHHSDREGARRTVRGAQADARLSRRAFVLRGSAALAAGAAMPFTLAEGSSAETAPVDFSEQQKKILSAVQTHVFPGDAGSPGALEINALPYLQFVIAQPDFDADSRNLIFNGLESLKEAGMEQFGRGIEDLDFAQKERLLRHLADHTRWGRNWLSLLLYYLFEALLADPVYGCNPDGIAWKWLEHQPGFPRPTPDKIYTRL